MILKRCSFSGCREYVPSGYCARHRRQKNQTYGRRHRDGRPAVMAQAGWRCHYCGHPVTLNDDVAHLERTQHIPPHLAPHAPRVPAHRACHNTHAPHLGAND